MKARAGDKPPHTFHRCLQSRRASGKRRGTAGSMAMPVKIHLSSHVRSYTGGQAEVEAEGDTLVDMMADLERRYPGIRFRVIDEQGRIRPHMNFFVGGLLAR